MEKREGRGRWLIGPVLAIVLILVFWPGHQNLLRKSTRVATFDAVLDTHCLWISDHVGIYLRYRQDGAGFELARLDTDTGKLTPMEALNRKYSAMMQWPMPGAKSFNRQGERIWHWMPLHDVSPDGRWLVFSTPTTRKADHTLPGSYIAMTLDGTKEVQWQATTLYPRNPLWLKDGRRWLEPLLEYKQQAVLSALIVHDLDRPLEDRRIPVVGAVRFMGIFGVTATDQLVVTEWNRYSTGVFSPPFAAAYVTYDVPTLSTGTSPGKLIRYRVPLPEEAGGGGESVLSPQGDRLAWHFRSRHSSWVERILHRFIPAIPLRFDEWDGIWVSRLDGTEMTEIGHNVLSSPAHVPPLFQMQWLPEGKKISFLNGSGIYTVPVP